MFYDNHFSPESISPAELDAWLALGGYRMHQGLFTSSHVVLEAYAFYRVFWLRYDVRSLVPRRSHRRLRHRNASLATTITPFAGIEPAHHKLHQKYRASIDFDGAPSIQTCLFGDGPVDGNIFPTHCLSVFDDDRLVAGGFLDLGATSAASILHYFDPEYSRRSLGKFLILITIDLLRATGRFWYYPGYVVRGHPKMDYKLFLGEDQAQYFDPETARWHPFSRTLLSGDPEADRVQLARGIAEAARTGRLPSHPLLAAAGEQKDAAALLRDGPRLAGEFMARSSDA